LGLPTLLWLHLNELVLNRGLQTGINVDLPHLNLAYIEDSTWLVEEEVLKLQCYLVIDDSSVLVEVKSVEESGYFLDLGVGHSSKEAFPAVSVVEEELLDFGLIYELYEKIEVYVDVLASWGPGGKSGVLQ
jgi:hypothetical protein